MDFERKIEHENKLKSRNTSFSTVPAVMQYQIDKERVKQNEKKNFINKSYDRKKSSIL